MVGIVAAGGRVKLWNPLKSVGKQWISHQLQHPQGIQPYFPSQLSPKDIAESLFWGFLSDSLLRAVSFPVVAAAAFSLAF